MAAPKVKFKRSSVAHKAPGLANLELGELALNTYDGKLFTRKDTGGVGIATTVTVLNPWDENYGGESITYAGIQTSGGGTTTDYSTLTLSGLTPTGFNTTYTRQSTGFVLDTGTVASGNALFDTDSNHYYYVDSGDNSRILIFSESDNNWMGVASTSASATTEYNVVTTSNLSPSSFNQRYVRQATGFVLDTGTIASGNALFKADSNYYYYVASTGSNDEDRIIIYSEEDGGWMTLLDFDDPDFREGNISDNQAVGSSNIYSAALTTNSDTFNGRNVPDADSSNVTYDTTRDYTSLTLDAGISLFDGTYTRQSFKANLDTGTVSSGNALFNATSDYWWFLKDDDNSKMIIFDSVTTQWTYVGRTGADFSSAADNTAVGSANLNESQTITAVAYESGAYQPDANYSEITYDALSGTNFSEGNLTNNQAVGSGVTFVTVTSGKTTADSRSVPTASGSIVYGTSGSGITTSRVGVVTITQDGHAQYAGVVTAYSFSGDLTGSLTGNVTGNADTATAADTIKTISRSTNANHHITFVDSNNGSSTAENLYTDNGLYYNPSSNILSGSYANFAAYYINGSQITSTAAELNILDGATLSTSELNILDGVTASTSELNILDGVTATTAELNYSDGVTSNIQTQFDNIVTLTGVSAGSTTLGTFTGTTISDNKDVKTALQELETAVDNVVGGNSGSATILTQSTSTNSSHFLTFVTDNNASATQESIRTDDALSYNPSTNILTVGGSGHIVSNVVGDIIGDVTGTADMADNVSVTNISTTNTAFTLVMSDGSNTSTGRALGMDSSLTYNPNTNVLTAETVNGNLTGNVTGDVTGTASTANTVKTQLSTSNANHHLTFVDSNNSSATAETVYTDASLHYNPITNQLTAPGVNMTILSLDGTDVTSTAAELNILDGVTATAAELNVLDGIASLDTDLTSVSSNDDTLASAKAIKTYVDSQVTAQDLDFTADTGGVRSIDLDSETFSILGTANEIETAGSSNTVTIGLPDNVSVFNNLTVGGNITIGGTLTYEDVANVDSVGLVTARSGVIVNGAGIGLSVTEGGARITGVTTSSGGFVGNLTGNVTGNVSGNVTGNLDGIVGGNTPAAVTGTTITANTGFTGDLTGDVTGDVTGTATTATNAVQLQTARNIGGVSFNGTADINLPGVNATGNQDTTGNAATATALANPRTIGGVSFNGTGNINLPGVNATGNQDTSGNAATATALATARTIHGVSFDGTSNIDLSEVIQDTVGGMFGSNTETGITVTYEDSDGTIDLVVGTLNQDTTGTAALAEGLTGTPNITVGVVTASSLDISGNVDVDGTLEADAITIDGVSLAETISDTVGSMVTSNTETGISVTYDDSDNTLDFVIGTLNQDTTGNAATATALETARNIGGVSFNGTADINLPGVNATGNQDTSGNAATATQLATARTIAGVSFDGTSNISLNNNAITNGAGYITTSFTNTNQLTNGAGFITNNVTGDFTVSGSVSIGGTLTYEDVKNVDSVGIVTANAGLKIPDNQKANFGTGDDLQIYHDGSHSYIDDAGTGNLKVRSGTLNITNLAGSKTSANFNSATGQELFYNNTKRFETTNTGATITGALVAGGLTYPTSDGTANQVLVTDGSGNLSFADQSLPTGVTTTTTTNETSIDTFSSSTYSTGIYHIQATRGGDVELTQFKVIHNGTTTFITEFGTVSTGPGIATYSADINSGNVRLLAYPSSSDSTVFKKDRTLIETGTSPAGSTTTTSTSTTNIDTVSTTNKAVVYEIECSRGTAVHLTTINLVHDGTSVYLSEFGTVKSGNSLATFDADISGSTIRLRATPTTSDSTTFNVNRTVMT